MNWLRLDETVEQRYFRAVSSYEGVIYTCGTTGPSPEWNRDAATVLFECRDGRSLEPVDSPCPTLVVIGWTVAGNHVIGATHAGTLLVRRSSGWCVAGTFPVPDDVVGRYAPLTWFDA